MSSVRLRLSADRVRELLTEGKVSLKIDSKEVDTQLEDEVFDLVDRDRERGREDPYSEEQAEKDLKHYRSVIQKQAKEAARGVVRAARAIPSWNGSLITIRLRASGSFLGKTTVLSLDAPEGVSVTTDVYVGPINKHISFMYSGGNHVDDVLDAGDPDFFSDQKVEADYFALVNELRHPGRSSREGKKVLVLYTARPAKDRKRYEKAKTLPNNIFLTTSPSEAEGYKMDFGGDRDIYKVRIQARFLVKTLDAHRIQNYQVFGPSGKAPVVSISLY